MRRLPGTGRAAGSCHSDSIRRGGSRTGPRRLVFVCGVEKNQPFRSKSQDAPVELSAPDTVGFAIPLDGVSDFF